MKKIKTGIIGVGNISMNHINGYINSPNAELYAFCDISEERVKMMAERFGVKHAFTNMDEMLRLKELDAVSVCTFNAAHAPCAVAALNAGKHVLCEKPMALSEKEALDMLTASKKNNKLLMIGFVRRFGNDCETVKDFIDNDFFGEIYYAKAKYLRRHGSPGGWFGKKDLSGGGPLIDLGVHVIDLTRYLMGNPKPVSVYGVTFEKLGSRPWIKNQSEYQSVAARKNDGFDVEDLATAMIRYENGAVLHIEASFSLNLKNEERSIELFGTKGGARLDPSLELYTNMNGHLTNISFAAPTELSFQGLFEKEVDHFVNCVANGTKCRAPAEDGVAVMRILDAVYESARTGHEVRLS